MSRILKPPTPGSTPPPRAGSNLLSGRRTLMSITTYARTAMRDSSISTALAAAIFLGVLVPRAAATNSINIDDSTDVPTVGSPEYGPVEYGGNGSLTILSDSHDEFLHFTFSPTHWPMATISWTLDMLEPSGSLSDRLVMSEDASTGLVTISFGSDPDIIPQAGHSWGPDVTEDGTFQLVMYRAALSPSTYHYDDIFVRSDVPEPCTLSVLTLGGLTLIRRRRVAPRRG